MTHLSPAAFTAWSVLSTTVCTTVMSYTLLCWQQLISRHDGRVRCVDFSLATCGGLTGSNAFGVWSFLLLGLEARADRDSYSWSSGPYTGAFKRFMTVCFFQTHHWFRRDSRDTSATVHVHADTPVTHDIFLWIHIHKIHGRIRWCSTSWEYVYLSPL